MPGDIGALFDSDVTPNPDSLFSPLQFATRVSASYQPIDPAIEFQNPVGKMYATFSYNQMTNGVQWTVLWYYQGQLVYYETAPWEGGSGGYGYSEWEPSAESWIPGLYEVQIFIGSEWEISGYFTVIGNPPTSTHTPTLTKTHTPTNTPTNTRTPRPTDTRMPTLTPTQ